MCQLPVYIFVNPSSRMSVHRSKMGSLNTVFLGFNGKLDVWFNAADVFSELLHIVFMKYGECVIHVS